MTNHRDQVRAQAAAMDAADRDMIEKLRVTAVYPRFLGLDDGGSYVWELADGSWTWADSPDEAVSKTRKFSPLDYCVKYGQPTPLNTGPTNEGTGGKA